MARPMVETVSVRYDFTVEERADLGRDLAKTRQDRTKLEAEEKSQRAQMATRRTELELRDETLCRIINDGFEMRSHECTLRWDDPNVGEVSYYRQDNGAHIKTRAMTIAERQLDLPLQTEEQTKQNVVSFFKKGGEVVDGGKDAPEGEKGAEPSPEAQQPQGEAVAEPQEPTEAPIEFQGSLEEYHAQNGSTPEPPTPPLPARGKRPKNKPVDTPA